MPTTINGIGTRYVGKKNQQAREGVCEQCGKHAELSSYDTRLWFCFIFIPLIPLGHKKILDDCSRCRRHYAMPLGQYQQMQEETLTTLAGEVRQNPADLDKAIEYNSALWEFGRAEEAQRQLAKLLRAFEDEAQAQFYAGAVCEQEGRTNEARRFFDLAYQIDASYPPARRQRARREIEGGNLEQASSLLSPSSLSVEETDPSLLFQLAQGYRERGDHVRAMDLDQRLVRDFPGIDQSKEFRKAVKSSEKVLPMSRTILGKKQQPWGKIALAATAMILLVAGGLVYNGYRKGNQTLYVVNGYPDTVTVSIDGEERLTFHAPGHRILTIAEGPHRITASGAIMEEMDFELERGFWSRFGSAPAYVVNLGGLAALIEEETTYASDPKHGAEPVMRVLGGDGFMVFQDIDYPFVDFPEEISMPSRSKAVQKKRLGLFPGEPEDLGGWVLIYGGPQHAIRYLEAWLAVRPTDALALAYSGTATQAGESERATELLRSKLTLHPTNVDWHRAYQGVAESAGLAEILAEYDGHLGASPQDPDLLYLRGRIEPDPKIALGYYGRALARAPEHKFALGASAYAHMSLGNFRRAADLLQPAAGGPEADPGLLDSYLNAVVAGGDEKEARRALNRRIEEGGEDFSWEYARRLALLEVRAGSVERAEAVAAKLAEVASGADDSFPLWIESQILYAKNDYGALRQLIRRNDFPFLWRDQMEFWIAVETNDVMAVKQSLHAGGSSGADGHNELVASLLFDRSGLEGAARQWEAEGLATLTRARPEAAIAAELLAGDRPLTRRAVDLMAVEPRYKAPLLTMLALRFPEDRNWLLAEAQRFSYLPEFPHHFLKSFAEEGS